MFVFPKTRNQESPQLFCDDILKQNLKKDETEYLVCTCLTGDAILTSIDIPSSEFITADSTLEVELYIGEYCGVDW